MKAMARMKDHDENNDDDEQLADDRPALKPTCYGTHNDHKGENYDDGNQRDEWDYDDRDDNDE